MTQRQVALPDVPSDFIETSVASGQYASGGEVISEALLSMVVRRSDQAKLKWLQAPYCIGIESGDAAELDFEALKAQGRARLKQR